METSVAAGERVVFAVNGDIAKAHRRVRVKEEDWGAQACKTSRSSNVVWLNKVGTFGVASAAFWWSRLMGLLGRHALNLSRNDWVFVLTFVDDLHIAAAGTNRWLAIWRFIVALELVGAPFSYKKFRGGFSLDYVGYWMDYSRFQLGLSEKRTTWLIGFIDQMAGPYPAVPGIPRETWLHCPSTSLVEALDGPGVFLACSSWEKLNLEVARASCYCVCLHPQEIPQWPQKGIVRPGGDQSW